MLSPLQDWDFGRGKVEEPSDWFNLEARFSRAPECAGHNGESVQRCTKDSSNFGQEPPGLDLAQHTANSAARISIVIYLVHYTLNSIKLIAHSSLEATNFDTNAPCE